MRLRHNRIRIAMRLSLLICLFMLLFFVTASKAQKSNPKAKRINFGSEETQLLYREYRGVHLGMTTDEARVKLGTPELKGDDQDYYVFSANESAQIVYNTAHKVVTISADYVGGVGAPDYRTVVSGELELRSNGSKYRMQLHEREGYWVSYNISSATVPVVTVTLQAILK